MDRPRIRVDFNELVDSSLVLLSQMNLVTDSAGVQIQLIPGLEVHLYEHNAYGDGTHEYLIADGVAEVNDPGINGNWTKAAKWCCRINAAGIRTADFGNT